MTEAVLKLRCGFSSLKLHACGGNANDLLAARHEDDELGPRVWLLGIPDDELRAFAQTILDTLGESS
jgi:hypothetical protein